jgi:hypothetical protein
MADAPATRLRDNFDGLDVSRDAALTLGPLNYSKANQSPSLYRYPRRCIRAADELTHIATAKALRRFKAELFEGVKLVEVLELARAIEHSPTLRQAECKKPSSQ